MADKAKVLQAANLVKLGMARELKECLAACSPEAVNNQDDQGREIDGGCCVTGTHVYCNPSLGARFRSEGRLAFYCVAVSFAMAAGMHYGCFAAGSAGTRPLWRTVPTGPLTLGKWVTSPVPVVWRTTHCRHGTIQLSLVSLCFFGEVSDVRLVPLTRSSACPQLVSSFKLGSRPSGHLHMFRPLPPWLQ